MVVCQQGRILSADTPKWLREKGGIYQGLKQRELGIDFEYQDFLDFSFMLYLKSMKVFCKEK